jgi:hypothetical protein
MINLLRQKKYMIYIFIFVSFFSSILFPIFWRNHLFWFTYPSLLIYIILEYYLNLYKASIVLQNFDKKLFDKYKRNYFFGKQLIDWYFLKSDLLNEVQSEKFQLYFINTKLMARLILLTLGVFFLNIILIQIIGVL